MTGTPTTTGFPLIHKSHICFSWAALGNPGWDFESVLPYFKKSEDNRYDKSMLVIRLCFTTMTTYTIIQLFDSFDEEILILLRIQDTTVQEAS